MKQTEFLTRATHVNGWFPVVYMSCMSQNFRLFHVSNLSVRNFLIFLLMYTGSLPRCLVPPVPAGAAPHDLLRRPSRERYQWTAAGGAARRATGRRRRVLIAPSVGVAMTTRRMYVIWSGSGTCPGRRRHHLRRGHLARTRLPPCRGGRRPHRSRSDEAAAAVIG